MLYLAKTKDGSGMIYLSKDIQMEKYLALNCDIYQKEDDSEKEVLIATPEDGFLIEMPSFPETRTMRIIS